MRLCEHPDFDQAILRAREHLGSRGLRPAIIGCAASRKPVRLMG